MILKKLNQVMKIRKKTWGKFVVNKDYRLNDRLLSIYKNQNNKLSSEETDKCSEQTRKLNY